jgi:hypothetical protein
MQSCECSKNVRMFLPTAPAVCFCRLLLPCGYCFYGTVLETARYSLYFPINCYL